MKTLPIVDGRYDEEEGINLEFKSCLRGIPTSVWVTYSSFSNTFGGRIILGIKDGSNEIEGVKKPSMRVQELWNTLNNPEVVNLNILGPDDIWTFEVGEKTLIVMDVPRAERHLRPIYHRKLETGTYKRNGEGDYVCKMPEIASMIRDQSDVSYDTTVLDDTSFDDIDLDTLHMFRNEMATVYPNHLWNKESDQLFAEMIGAIGRKGSDKPLTVAGLLMFGKEYMIYRFIPNFKLDYREYRSDIGDWIFRLVTGDGMWVGNLYNYFTKVMSRLMSDVNNPYDIGSNLKRIENTDVHKAIRESVLNAVIHTDYLGKDGITIVKRPNEIEISNSGLFRIPLEVAERGGESDPRNMVLAKMFSMIGYVERAGVGVNLIMRTWKNHFNTIPGIEEDTKKGLVRISLKSTKKSNEISDVSQSILDLIDNNPGISIVDMAARIGVSTSTISNHIKSLRIAGIIERVGGTRGRWKINL